MSVPTGNSGITVSACLLPKRDDDDGSPDQTYPSGRRRRCRPVQPLQRLFPVAGRFRAHAGRCSRAFLRCASRKERPQSSCPGIEGAWRPICRSVDHTSELPSLLLISYFVFFFINYILFFFFFF